VQFGAFLGPVQQKMYNAVFNLDLGDQSDDIRVIKSGTENRRLSVPLLKVAQNLPCLSYRFRSPRINLHQSLGDRRVIVVGILLKMSTHERDWNVVHIWHHKHPLYNTKKRTDRLS